MALPGRDGQVSNPERGNGVVRKETECKEMNEHTELVCKGFILISSLVRSGTLSLTSGMPANSMVRCGQHVTVYTNQFGIS